MMRMMSVMPIACSVLIQRFGERDERMPTELLKVSG